MTKTFIATCALVAAMCHQCFSAEELLPGSKAPKLEVKKFVKGKEVKGFEKGKIYVVELWATWCPPCRATIPHLTDLQEKYKDVTIIGVAVLEEEQSEVPPFVEEMGDKMNYRVALDLIPEDGDPNNGKVVQNWMKAAGFETIPDAFIVNGDGKIAWIGHPEELEEPLGQVVSGKWDIELAAKKYTEARALEKEERAAQKKMAEIYGQLQALHKQFLDDGKPDEFLTALDAAAKELPENTMTFQMMRFQVLSCCKDRTDEAMEVANALLASDKGEDSRFLGDVAWIVVNPDRDTKAEPKLLKLALKVALKADKLAESEDPSVADTLAKAYFDNGDLANAVKTQEHVMELIKGTPLVADPGLEKRLKQYKKALNTAGAKPKETSDPAKSAKK